MTVVDRKIEPATTWCFVRAADPIAPGASVLVELRPERPFKILRAHPERGIDYRAFASPRMFIGATCFPAKTPWELHLCFSDFLWPRGGGWSETNPIGPDNPFSIAVTNKMARALPFAIWFEGLSL